MCFYLEAMKLQKFGTEENERKGYWFRSSNEHIYIVELKCRYSDNDKDLINVIATVYEPDCNNIDNTVDITKLKNGEEVTYDWLFDDDEWIMSIDIWGKYYFPKFNEEKNQWYHRMGADETCYMDDFSFILKEAYTTALKVTGLKMY